MPQLEDESLHVEVALLFTDCSDAQVYGYSNTILGDEAGVHVAGLKAGIVATYNSEYRSELSEEAGWRDIAHGIRAAVSVWHPDPQTEHAKKWILMNLGVLGAVAEVAYASFSDYLRRLKLDDKQQLFQMLSRD